MSSQKAMLHHILEVNKLKPSNFEIVPSTSHGAARFQGDQVRLKGTDYYFGIYPTNSEYSSAEKFFVEYSPGNEEIREIELCGNWEIVCITFATYLSFLHREITTDDPWKQEGVVRVTKRSKDQTLIPAGHHFTGQRLAKAILSEATESLDILDPYLGVELFDRIDDAGIQVPIRILTSPKSNNSLSYYQAFKESYPKIELRLLQAAKLHDRFIIVDRSAGYHLGHSVKDLGKKDTQLSPIDNIQPLLGLFEERWSEAESTLRQS